MSVPPKHIMVPPTSKSSDVKSKKAATELKNLRMHREAAKSGAVPITEKPDSRGTNDDILNVIDQAEPQPPVPPVMEPKTKSFVD